MLFNNYSFPKNLHKVFFILFILILSLPALSQYKSTLSEKIARGDSLFIIADFKGAESIYFEASPIAESEKNVRSVIYIKNRIAECNLRNGDILTAEKKILDNLDFIEKNQPQENKLYAVALDVLALVEMSKGLNDQALEHLQLSQKKFLKSGETTSPEFAKLINDLGLLYWNTGNNELALEHLINAGNLRQLLFGKNHPEVAGSYNNIGLVYIESEPEMANEYFNKALEIYKSAFSGNHPSIAAAYNNIAIVNRKLKNYDEAIRNLNEVENIWIALFSKDHPNVAFVYSNRAGIYVEQEMYKEALAESYKALSIYRKNYGDRHPEIASVYNLISQIFLSRKKYDSALVYVQRALIANSAEYNIQSIESNPPVKNYYSADLFLGSLIIKSEALEARYFNKTIKLKDLELASQTLLTCDTLIDKIRQSRINKEDKLRFGAIAAEVYESGMRINLAMKDVTGRKKYLHTAFYFSEKSKSAVLLEAISETQAKHFAKIPDKLLEEEKMLKSDIAYYEHKLAQGTSEESEIRNELFNLNQKYQDLIASMERNYPQYFDLKYNIKTSTVTDLQQSLDSTSMIISYVIAEKSNRIYIFRIGKKSFEVLDVARDENFEKYVKGFRNSIISKSDKTYFLTASYLYKKLFPGEISSRVKNLIIIPDGRLGTIPFEAMLTRSSSPGSASYKELPYLIKRYSVSYTYSATLYAQSFAGENQMAINGADIFLCAPVNFGNDINALPSTEKEVKSIGQIFTDKGRSCKQCLFEQANEQIIKSGILKDYMILHFATHGLVDENNPELSRIFLVPDSTAERDGCLSSGEIYNLELNADLVTLSACQTGLGKISKGEGIIGLSRALLYAGAKNISVSLWSVADKSTSDLMIDFYISYLDGNSKAEALRLAKLKMIQNGVEESNGKLDVYYWSPFILIGK